MLRWKQILIQGCIDVEDKNGCPLYKASGLQGIYADSSFSNTLFPCSDYFPPILLNLWPVEYEQSWEDDGRIREQLRAILGEGKMWKNFMVEKGHCKDGAVSLYLRDLGKDKKLLFSENVLSWKRTDSFYPSFQVVSRNKILAEKYLTEAAKAGNQSAQYYLGTAILLYSSVLARDEIQSEDNVAAKMKGLELINASARQGHPGALEIHAQFSEKFSEMSLLRKKAAYKGCETSIAYFRTVFRMAWVDLDWGIPILKEELSSADLFTLAFLEGFLAIKRGNMELPPSMHRMRVDEPLYFHFEKIKFVIADENGKNIEQRISLFRDKAIVLFNEIDKTLDASEFTPPTFVSNLRARNSETGKAPFVKIDQEKIVEIGGVLFER